MALTYTQDNFYTTMNKLLSAVQEPTPKNMTLIPDYQKSNFLKDLAPKTQGPMTVVSGDGNLMSVPENTPLYEVNKISHQVGGRVIEELQPSQISPEAVIPQVMLKQLGSGDKAFDLWRSMHGKTSTSQADIEADYAQYIERAGQAKIGSAILSGIGSILDAKSGYDYRKEVEATKTQYETQKKIIDTNIDKTESALMENLMSNMADLDVMTAARNVDLSSQAIVGDKAKGAMDLGRDIADMRTNGSLQKAALDLEYKMNVAKAKRAETQGYVSAGLQIAGTALSLL